jgi:energy-coupling factor transport system ATP-binding protein
MLGRGGLVAQGTPQAVLGGSPLFAPQVARLFPGRGWLTADDALAGRGGSESRGVLARRGSARVDPTKAVISLTTLKYGALKTAV